MSRFRGYAFREGDIASSGVRSVISCPNQNCLWPKSVDGFVYVPYTISPLYGGLNIILSILMGRWSSEALLSSVSCIKCWEGQADVVKMARGKDLRFFTRVCIWRTLAVRSMRSWISNTFNLKTQSNNTSWNIPGPKTITFPEHSTKKCFIWKRNDHCCGVTIHRRIKVLF